LDEAVAAHQRVYRGGIALNYERLLCHEDSGAHSVTGDAAQAIEAGLGAAAVGVEIDHSHGCWTVLFAEYEDAVSADPEPPVAKSFYHVGIGNSDMGLRSPIKQHEIVTQTLILLKWD
jgi:hypothetical protein